MLTPRGEHFYFIANTNVTLILMNLHMAPARFRELSRGEQVAYVRPLVSVVRENQPAPGGVHSFFVAYARTDPGGDALGLETHPRRRGGADFARNGQCSRDSETGRARTGFSHRLLGETHFSVLAYSVLYRWISQRRMATLIFHRFSTVRMAAHPGRHHQTAARGGRYAELFELQPAGYR
jgi:hypothetical protein